LPNHYGFLQNSPFIHPQRARQSCRRGWNRDGPIFYSNVKPKFRRQESGTLLNYTRSANSSSNDAGGFNSSAASNFTFPASSAIVQPANLAVQGILVTTTVPLYEVCNYQGSTRTSACTTVQETVTSSSCSTVITAGFNRYSISECDQNITLSTISSFSVVTLLPNTSSRPVLNERGSECYLPDTIWVQVIVTYYIANWRSLLSGTPSDVYISVCKSQQIGKASCSGAEELWTLYTSHIATTLTSVVSVAQFFQYISLSLY
jgi:hypothetical protein